MPADDGAVHERLRWLRGHGLSVGRTLGEMLSELPHHRTERRGCGYTQATRYLATRIVAARDPLDPSDLLLLGDWPLRRVEVLARQARQAGWPAGWRALHRAPTDVLEALPDVELVEAVAGPGRALDTLARLEGPPGMRVFAGLLRQVIGGGHSSAPELPAMTRLPGIGSCSQAEEFFLEIAHGKIRRGGRVNVYAGADGQPLLVEKIDLGESHSAMSLAPLQLNGVELPAGSLFALQVDGSRPALASSPRGGVFDLSAIGQARFLRLSTLAVPPPERASVFTRQFETQVQRDFLSPATTTIDDLAHYAQVRIAAAA